MNAKLTQVELQAIKERADKATGGPWEWDDEYSKYELTGAENRCVIDAENGFGIAQIRIHDNNAEFIAHARQDIPQLVAEVERLEEVATARYHLIKGYKRIVDEKNAEIARLRKALEFYANEANYGYTANVYEINEDEGKLAREALE